MLGFGLCTVQPEVKGEAQSGHDDTSSFFVCAWRYSLLSSNEVQ